MSNTIVRPMSEADLPVLMTLIGSMNTDMSQELLRDRICVGMRNATTFLGIFSNEECAGVVGYWFADFVYCGRHLYVDSFVIAEKFRSVGFGKKLLDHVEHVARQAGCACVLLDAYLKNTRAHAFYQREGYEIKGYHFNKPIQ